LFSLFPHVICCGFIFRLEKQSYSLGYEHMGETLREFMGHSGAFNEELQKVELIDGEEELALFRQLDNNHSENQIVSPIKLEI